MEAWSIRSELATGMVQSCAAVEHCIPVRSRSSLTVVEKVVVCSGTAVGSTKMFGCIVEDHLMEVQALLCTHCSRCLE